MPKRRKKLHLTGIGVEDPNSGNPMRTKVGDMHILVCCDCELRHIVSIERSPFGKDEVIVRMWRDNHGTDDARKLKRITVRRAGKKVPAKRQKGKG